MKPLLDVQDLTIGFDSYAGRVTAVNNIKFQLFPGEALGIVGESGCGKSATAQAIMRLISTPPGRYLNGRILFNDLDLLKVPESQLETIRGNEISMVFQDPMTSFNPVLTIGRQIAESLELHHALTKIDALNQAVEMLRLVGIPAPEQRIRAYPHQFSGGMRQRAMIAMALACHPKLLIADEPTTALDVTIQAQILDLLKKVQTDYATAIIYISHDLGTVAQLCSRVLVMYAGKIIEAGLVQDIFHRPSHPYTRGLLKSMPRLNTPQRQRLTAIAGQPPDLLQPPSGCPFHPRCSHAMKVCAEHYPGTTKLTPAHQVNCWLQHPEAPKLEHEVELR